MKSIEFWQRRQTFAFSDGCRIELHPDSTQVTITTNEETLVFNEEDKPVFPSTTGESVIEYSGLATNPENTQRSWAIAKFEPNGKSTAHAHRARIEGYYITKGSGVIIVDGIEHPVSQGMYLQILPNQTHQVQNRSATLPMSIIVKCEPSWTIDDYVLPHAETTQDETSSYRK